MAAPRKNDRFQAAEAHLPDGVVKEVVRELHAATLAECSGDWRQVGVSRGQGRKQDETVGGEAQDARGASPRFEEGQRR